MARITEDLPETLIDGPLYASAARIYPQKVRGVFRQIKWAILLVCLGIYYLLPFVRWDRGPNLPDQAVLVDMDRARLYFFFIEIWPQEIYYLTGLLVLASLALFLMNAVAGRLWCGYLCPQTVWTDLFLAVERWIEGDRRDRIRLDQAPLSVDKAARKTAKYFIWLMIAWWTGGAWVLYFNDAPTLVWQLLHFEAPFRAYVWIGILTCTTFVFAGLMREQVCLYMCPWPRIQAALTDEHALNVAYRYTRGEPRMSVKSAQKAKEAHEPAGDCVDCRQCVNVCPTGVDIREGSQLGCIQCGLCIDACDSIMERIGRPTGLIAYDSDAALKARAAGEVPEYRIFRPRTILYTALIALVGGLMLYKLLTRSGAEISVLHERVPQFITLADGSIRNVYAARLSNKTLETRTFLVTVSGIEGARVAIAGEDQRSNDVTVEIGADQVRDLRLMVTVPRAAATGAERSRPIRFGMQDVLGNERVTARDNFFVPVP